MKSLSKVRSNEMADLTRAELEEYFYKGYNNIEQRRRAMTADARSPWSKYYDLKRDIQKFDVASASDEALRGMVNRERVYLKREYSSLSGMKRKDVRALEQMMINSGYSKKDFEIVQARGREFTTYKVTTAEGTSYIKASDLRDYWETVDSVDENLPNGVRGVYDSGEKMELIRELYFVNKMDADDIVDYLKEQNRNTIAERNKKDADILFNALIESEGNVEGDF